MTDLVEVKGNQVVVGSRSVAEKFSKLHKHVLDSIREILSAEKSANKFFKEISYVYKGRTLPEYLMTRDGFSLLAMGFTGQKALQWKIKYIEAFNRMEEALKHPKEELPAGRFPRYCKYLQGGSCHDRYRPAMALRYFLGFCTCKHQEAPYPCGCD